jgi:hypothetical protein
MLFRIVHTNVWKRCFIHVVWEFWRGSRMFIRRDAVVIVLFLLIPIADCLNIWNCWNICRIWRMQSWFPDYATLKLKCACKIFSGILSRLRTRYATILSHRGIKLWRKWHESVKRSLNLKWICEINSIDKICLFWFRLIDRGGDFYQQQTYKFWCR